MTIQIIILVILCLVFQSLFIAIEHQKKYKLAVVLKGLASLCFIIIGIITFNKENNLNFSRLVLIGLCLGALGDILLNLRFIFNEKINSKIFITGVLSFLIGHILYLCALIPLSNTLVHAIQVGIIVATIILLLIFKKIKVKLSYKIFGIIYIGAVVLMTSIAVFNLFTLKNTYSLLFAIGAILFTTSDVILIFNSFGPKQIFIYRITNLTLYYIGQLLIAISLIYI